jgi:hypothetical protein
LATNLKAIDLARVEERIMVEIARVEERVMVEIARVEEQTKVVELIKVKGLIREKDSTINDVLYTAPITISINLLING